ncbi:Crp/Fnr family transcriptional regulator [Listeria monocytogenes]|uniref:Crp/Fnr family transcriptional regulator n=1 Tax=Listeria seeligeri TaxID=1640 RepID=UPI0022EC0689|nr:Crp/Fnr family transcriptional regulator [Listeria seeligeri]EKT6042414.1 Crp/Fnr family transcriptional regulator [Listeria monocytogenes]EKT6045423.1 Crp/Fnr family transcriptional regulator [Listeria monocytogenes]
MTTMFDYTEFIQLAHKGRITYEKLTLPKGVVIANTPEFPSDCVYLIIEGFVTCSFLHNPSRVYTICGKGNFLNYYALLETDKHTFKFQMVSTCVIYKFVAKDVEYLLSMFPENYGFQFFIMKDLAKHAYYKSIAVDKAGPEKVRLTMQYLGQLHGIPAEPGVVVIPKAIPQHAILSYCGVSKGTFYKQTAILQQKGLLRKKENQWILYDQALYDYCCERTERLTSF